MRFLIFSVLIISTAFGSFAVAEENLTLAQKIALAKKMADDGVSGRAQSGLVVSGKFSFSDILTKYRVQENLDTVDSKAKKGDGVSDDSDITDIEKIEESQTAKVRRIQEERKEELVAKKAVEAKIAIEAVEEPKIEEISRPANFPSANKPINLETDKTADLLQSAGAQKKLLDTKLPSTDNSLPKSSDLLKKDSDKQKSQEKNLIKDKNPVKPKYVVDTSKDFVNGFFVGKIDGQQVKSEHADLKKSIKAAEKEVSLEKKYYNVENGMFYVVSDDYDAMKMGMLFVKEAEKIFNDFFSTYPTKITFIRKITLQMVADKNFEMKGSFSVMTSDNGDLTLAAKWDKNLDFYGFCKLVTGSVLRKLAFENGYFQEWKNPPYWLELGFSEILAQALQYGTPIQLARVSAQNPPSSIAEILNYKRDDSFSEEIKSANSYWLLKSLEKSGKSKSVLPKFMLFLLTNKQDSTIISAIEASMKPVGLDIDLWWRCLFTGEVYARLGGVNYPAWSEAELLRLAVVQVNDENGERIGISDFDIFLNREKIQNDLEVRVLEIKVALSKVNPLYYNALVDLGRMYEAAKDSDEETFKTAHNDFIKDLMIAKALAKKVEILMNAKEEDLKKDKATSVVK